MEHLDILGLFTVLVRHKLGEGADTTGRGNDHLIPDGDSFHFPMGFSDASSTYFPAFPSATLRVATLPSSFFNGMTMSHS